MNIQFYHPYPRYGFAAALVQTNKQLDEIKTYQDVATLAITAIDQLLNRFSVFTHDNPALESTTELDFFHLPAEKLSPEKKGRTNISKRILYSSSCTNFRWIIVTLCIS